MPAFLVRAAACATARCLNASSTCCLSHTPPFSGSPVDEVVRDRSPICGPWCKGGRREGGTVSSYCHLLKPLPSTGNTAPQ